MVPKQQLIWQVGLPLLLMALLTPWSAFLDHAVTDFFYVDGHFVSHPFFQFMYHYGFFPAWIFAAVAALAWIGSYFFPWLKPHRLPALFLMLMLAIGPGLIVHAIFKDHWGRPRPKQVIEYGGQQTFRAYYQPNLSHQPEPSKSFPCGHASMGFYFFAIALLGRYYQNKALYYGGMGLSFILGGLLGLARIAQGGHFLSDVLMTALMMWLTALILYAWLFNRAQGVKYERPNTKAE